jgi:hypothetical protein
MNKITVKKKVCLFFCFVYSRLSNFFSYPAAVTITGEGLQI